MVIWGDLMKTPRERSETMGYKQISEEIIVSFFLNGMEIRSVNPTQDEVMDKQMKIKVERKSSK